MAAAPPTKKRQRDDDVATNKKSKLSSDDNGNADAAPAITMTDSEAWKIMLGAGANIEDTTSDALLANSAFKENMDSLNALDTECSLEQMKVQRKFEDKKRPLYKARDDIIAKERFWGKIIGQYPDFKAGLIDDQGREILSKHLIDFNVNDFLDDFGSYEISMTFDEAVSQYFSPSKLVRMVKFKEDDEVDWTQGQVTSITWKDEAAKDSLRFLDFFQLSNFNGESALEQSVVTGIGDALRSDIYRKPLPKEWNLENGSDISDEDEEDDDDAEDEDDDEEDVSGDDE